MNNPLKLLILLILGTLFLMASADDIRELKFSHKLHIEENEIECETCHEGALESKTGSDNLFPEMETCADCHDIEDDENCSLCHTDVDDPRAVPRVVDYSPKFSHEKHLQGGLECNSCHDDVNKKTENQPYHLPGMVDCMNCHLKQNVSNACSNCHLPGEKLVPASHAGDFIHNHSDMARNSSSVIMNRMNCNTCHSTDYCQECHQGDNLDRLTHPINFEFTHALAAQGKENDCSACHSDRQFCSECHIDKQVMPHNHTAGWAIPGAGGRHTLEAKADLENCITCHEHNAEQICQPCHSN